MRRLLIDAQAKFRSMVEENKQIGTRIDGEVQSGHEDVAILRAELAESGARQLDSLAPATTPTPASTPASASSSTTASATPTSASSATGSTSTSDEPDKKNGDETKSALDDSEAPTKWSLSLSPLNQIIRPPSPKAGTSTTCDGPTNEPRPPPSKSPNSVGGGGDLPPSGSTAAVVSTRLRLENERLKREVAELRRLVSASGVSPGGSSASSASVAGVSPGDGGIQPEGAAPGFSVIADCDGPLRKVRSLEVELQQTKDALGALKADRKKLKAEKVDLLNQMKQLYGTLEDKEKELRDFIRNYEQRMRESEASLQQLSAERDERERERWSLLRHARDEAERSLELAAQLSQKEQQLAALQEQLSEARRSGCLSDQESLASASRINGLCLSSADDRAERTSLRDRNLGGSCSCSADSGVRGSSDRGNLSDSTTEGTPTITFEGGSLDMDSVSVESHHMYHTVGSPKDCVVGSPKECSPSLSPLNVHSFSSRSIDNNLLSRSVEQLSSPLESEPRRSKRNPLGGRIVGGGTWGSISRVFARSRHRKAISPTSQDDCSESFRSWSPLTEEGYAEKLRLLREAAAIPMERWRAPTVLAWLEIALGMPQYGPRCAENIKSGKVLLELSDEELEYGLGITHPMHRKKLRLAIEEHRHPALVRYPCIAQLTHTWVSSEWLPDLGLAQYSENFATNMVDARMLDHLSKKELEKFVGVTRKFHQASIVHGIHLLRMVKYDRQALAVRRHQSESVDADPLVWTNQRFMRWARAIDLHEYADNLKDSGVHGALVVLEPSFNGDTMATALGIPPSKNIIRRHLAAELESLVLPARAAFEHYVRVTTAERRRAERLVGGGSLGRSFSRSYTAGLAAERAYAPLTYSIPAPAPAPSATSTADTSPPSDQDNKDRRRASLRTYSLLYLKKLSSWRSSQGSLSRALGLGTTSRTRSRYRSDSAHTRVVRSIREDGLASPSSSSDNGSSSVASFQCRSASPCAPASTPGGGPPQRPPSITSGVHSTRRRHRRVKSIGDIDSITVTPV